MSKLLAPGELLDGVSVSLGVIVRAVGVTCDDQVGYIKTFDNIRRPGTDRGESNRLKVIELSDFGCKKYIRVDAYSSPTEIRAGWIGGALLVSSDGNVAIYKALADFVNNDIRILLGFVLVLLSLLVFQSKRVLSEGYSGSFVEAALPWLGLLNLLNAGAFVGLVPFLRDARSLNSISLWISSMSFLSIFFWHKGISKRKSAIISLALFVVLIASNSSALNYSILLGALLTVALVAYELRSRPTAIFLGFSLLAYLKAIGVQYAPHTHVHALYAGFIASEALLFKLGSVADSLKFLLSGYRSSGFPEKEDRVVQALELLQRSIRGSDVSLFIVEANQLCRYISKTNGTKVKFSSFDSLPPVVAHVLSTRSNLVHLDDRSEKFKAIIRNRDIRSQYKSHFFSGFSVDVKGKTSGVLMVSNYSSSCLDSGMGQDQFNVAIRLSLLAIQDALSKRISGEQIEFDARLVKIRAELQENISSVDSASFYLSRCLELLTNEFSASGMLFRLEPKTRALEKIRLAGYSSEVESYLRTVEFYAYLDNFQGPSVIAINNNQIVVTEDINWLKRVVKEKTFQLFQISEAKSTLAIPVVFGDESFVIWLESKIISSFRNDYVDTLTRFSKDLCDACLGIVANSQRDVLRKSLGNFVPKYVLEKIVRGEDPTEIERGFLLLFDLKGSTRLSLELGSEVYLAQAELLNNALRDKLSAHGWALQIFKWDALYLTNSKCTKEDLDVIVEEMRMIFSEWRSSLANRYAIELPSDSFRVCLVHGDVSRGLMTGATQQWTITGSAMALVSKLESGCKRLPGLVFTTGQCALFLGLAAKQTDALIPTLEERVYVVELNTLRSVA